MARYLRLRGCDCDCDPLRLALLGVMYVMSTPSTMATEPGAQYRVRKTSATSGVSSGAGSHSEGSESEVTADMSACFDIGFMPRQS